MRKPIIAATAILLSTAGVVGVAHASPSGGYPPTTSVGQEVPTTTSPGQIPKTGGDPDNTILLGLSAVAVGAGLVVVTRRRRRGTQAA